MSRPRHERLDSTPSTAPLLQVSRFESFSEEIVSKNLKELQDDPVWKEYVDSARDFDNKMFDEWNKFLDVTLVFIGLFIAVLTSFIIETGKSFKSDPAEVTNKILVLIFNKLSNSSLSSETLDLKKFEIGKKELSVAIVHNGLLFVSLALAIAISIISMAAKIWLVRYIGWVREPGSYYARAMKRQEAYTGMQRWKLHRVIDSLPIFTLVAVILFGIFIHRTIRGHHRGLGYIVAVIFLIGFTFFVLTSYSAAFIPSAPFQSPFSHFIAFVFKWILPKKGKRRLIVIAVSSTMIAALMIPLVVYKSTLYQLLIFLPVAGIFAVAEQKPKKSGKYFPLYGPPELVVLGGFTGFIPIAVALSVDTTRTQGRIAYIAVTSAGVVLLALCGYGMNWLTREVPDTLHVEAVAWLLELSRSKESESKLLEIASRIADTPQRKVLLLKTLLPLLPHLIASRRGNISGELEGKDLQMLLSHLKDLLDFDESHQSYWWNEAAVEHPTLTKDLGEQLEGLRTGVDPRLQAAAEDVRNHFRVDPTFKNEKTANTV